MKKEEKHTMSDKKRPKIILPGILNTKGNEIRYLGGQVEKYGGEPVYMDLSLGGEVDWADIPLEEVLACNNTSKEDVWKSTRTEAIDLVGNAGAVKIMELYEKGEVDGVISWAGTVGTSTISIVMRALPMGVPKVMLCSAASGDVSMWVGGKDIYMLNMIAEKGMNKVITKAVSNSAAGIVAMAKVGEIEEKDVKPLAAITAYGTTTQTVMKLEKHLEDRGWDTIIIHQVGTGAVMEDLIRSGGITAVLDITTGELSNTMHHTTFAIPDNWPGQRLTAASDMGIPQIVSPGGLAQIAWGAPDTVTKEILEQYESGERVSYKNSRAPHVHNPAVTVIAPTMEETRILAEEIISKLNMTKGPTALIVPMRGWSAYDQSAELANLERGWAKEKGDGPVWLPDPDKPEWSKRATLMYDLFEKKIDRGNPNLDLIQCDMHILDDEYIALCNRCIDDMIDGKWKKGLYRDMPKVVK
jgi:uncharacterized protein (UPF0261 family)